MSTAGLYGYHPYIQNPYKDYPGMESQQPPFFLGGSQVPVNLGFIGSGFRSDHVSHLDLMKHLSTQGRGIHTTAQKYNKVYLPKHMSTIKRVI